jgi:hypothetical protein
LAPVGKAVIARNRVFMDIAFDHSGRRAFAADYRNKVLLCYDVGADGYLVSKTPKAVTTQIAPDRLLMHPNKSWLYLLAFSGGIAMSAEDRHGNLSPVSTILGTSRSRYPSLLAFSPDGRYAYVLYGHTSTDRAIEPNGTTSIVAYRIRADGSFQKLGGPELTVRGAPNAIATARFP